jgi:hypothetical protein
LKALRVGLDDVDGAFEDAESWQQIVGTPVGTEMFPHRRDPILDLGGLSKQGTPTRHAS